MRRARTCASSYDEEKYEGRGLIFKFLRLAVGQIRLGHATASGSALLTYTEDSARRTDGVRAFEYST
jgi:hypothetical protein